MSSIRSRNAAGLLAALTAVTVLTGCSSLTAGRAATLAAGCTKAGASAAAATGVVRCYLGDVSREDTEAACALLSARARQQVLDAARNDEDNNHWDSAISPASSASCSAVSTTMRRALDRLPAGSLAQFRKELAAVKVGPATLDARQARVRVTADSSATQDVTLVQEGGGWKIGSGDAFVIDD